MIKCHAFQNLDKSINAILLFGLVRPVIQRKTVGFDYWGETIDQFGNVYEIFTEYDPALKRSGTFAIKVKENMK